MNPLINITNQEYRLITNLVYDKFGINLGDRKKALVAGRLQKVIKNNGFASFKEYYRNVIKDDTGKALNMLINRISTNHTFFYRENEHFSFFIKNALPEIINIINSRLEKNIRVWSSGCSSGEEAYTLAMLLEETISYSNNDLLFAVLGTDISETALKKAKNGIYSKENLLRLPINLKTKYFIKRKDGNFEINQHIKDLVLLRRLNLKTKIFPFKQKFHAVFCRNVMIYFDQPTRDELVEKYYKFMEKDSYLFTGLSEGLNRTNKYFKYVKPGVYRRIG